MIGVHAYANVAHVDITRKYKNDPTKIVCAISTWCVSSQALARTAESDEPQTCIESPRVKVYERNLHYRCWERDSGIFSILFMLLLRSFHFCHIWIFAALILFNF
jgi:hypothetical protein